MQFSHVPVMLSECIENLNIKEDGIYVDFTMGGAGHSGEILKKLNDKGRLIGIDQDIDAICAAKEKLLPLKKNVSFVHRNFSDILSILDELDINEADGGLIDLGVSSYQLDEAERGFSYIHDAPLDMRMDRRREKSAYTVINEYSRQELSDIIFKYGEERWAKRIAEFIEERRKISPIKTTGELTEIIKAAIPAGAREKGGHPGKRTFQAIRIEVNDELSIIEKTITDFARRLKSGGRLCVITFHSLEDRIVKDAFLKLSSGCTCPKDFPVCVCGGEKKGKVITRKPIVATKEELDINSRSKSAKLRVFEKI